MVVMLRQIFYTAIDSIRTQLSIVRTVMPSLSLSGIFCACLCIWEPKKRRVRGGEYLPIELILPVETWGNSLDKMTMQNRVDRMIYLTFCAARAITIIIVIAIKVIIIKNVAVAVSSMQHAALNCRQQQQQQLLATWVYRQNRSWQKGKTKAGKTCFSLQLREKRADKNK